MLDYLVLGGGPAGLQIAYYLSNANAKYRVFEQADDVGNFFARFPRHRKLISINKVYTGFDEPEVNMRWDWNSLLSDDARLRFQNYSREYFPQADDMHRYLRDFASFNGLEIELSTRIEAVRREEAGFVLTDQRGREWRGRRLVVASGLFKPYVPDIPGIELAESYNEVTLDREDFANQRVLIVGKGNSAFETADHIIAMAAKIHLISPNPVRMAWKSHYVGHLRAVNNNLLDTYQLKSQNALLDADIQRIEKHGDEFHVDVAYKHADSERETLVYDRLIACTGFRFDTSIFDQSCMPQLKINGRFPDQTSQWESVNVPDLFFAGTLTQVRDFKKSTSGFIHGFRYNARAFVHMARQRYEDIPWPSQTVANEPEALRDAVIARVNVSGGLWQQFGFLADLILVDEDGETARYYQEVPLDYFLDGGLGRPRRAFAITLDYGAPITGDPFNIERINRNDVQRAEESRFLHPIVRRYEDLEAVAEHHVIEDLESRWFEEVHLEPLREFFETGVAS